MSLLEFARGPALQWSLWIFCFGVLWRIVGATLLRKRKHHSKPRSHNTVGPGFTAILTRSAPAESFEKKIRFQHYSGYIWHIALFITVLFYAPHIEFFKAVLGFGWPNLPTPVVLVSAAIAIATLFALAVRRIRHPVMSVISNADDYISLIVVFVPLVTGLLAFAHIGGRYETLLAVHLLSVEAMFVWFPFGKLMHTFLTFPTRYQAGALFGRRGVKA